MTKDNEVFAEKPFPNSGVTRRLWGFQHATVLSFVSYELTTGGGNKNASLLRTSKKYRKSKTNLFTAVGGSIFTPDFVGSGILSVATMLQFAETEIALQLNWLYVDGS